MLEYALGMIETKGLVASIEAADVMVKTANVRIFDQESIRNGYVTIKIVGEVAAVKAAVDAAGVAAARIGQLITCHVIPRPAEEIESILQKPSTRKDVVEDIPRKANKKETPTSTLDLFSENVDDQQYRAQLMAMTVPQLRTFAREVGGLGIAGREISKANKEQLIGELMKKRTGA